MEVITDFGAELSTRGPQPSHSRSACASAPFRDAIELGLSRGRNAMAIWQDLVDNCGFTGSYQSVQRFVLKLRPGNSPEACAVIETAPGEECQVDYGTGPMVRDLATGKYRRTRLFVMTLGYSRKSVRLLVFRSSSQICMKRPFAGSLARRVWSYSITCAKAYSVRTSTIPP